MSTLAASELADYPNSRELIKKVIELGVGKLDVENKRWLSYFEPIEKQAKITLLSVTNYLVLEELIHLLKLAEDSFVRYEIANLISKVDPDNVTANKTLVELLTLIENEALRLRVSNSLIQIGSSNLKIEDSLIELARYGKQEWVRRDAAQFLLDFKPNHPVGINVLIKILSTSQNEPILWNLNLHEIGLKNPKLIRFLFKVSYSGKNTENRSISLSYLARILLSGQNRLEEIIGFVQLPKKILSLFGISSKVQNYGEDCLRYIAKLVDEVCVSQDNKHRKEAFWKLIDFTFKQPNISLSFYKILLEKSGKETKKKQIFELFKELDIDADFIIPIWIDLINDLRDSKVRTFLAIRVSSAGFEDERISVVLTDLLNNADFESEHIRRWLAEGLQENDPTDSNSIATFLDLLNHSESWNTCQWVANDLGEACNSNNKSLVRLLLKLLSKSRKARISNSIASGFTEIIEPNMLRMLVHGLRKNIRKEAWKNNFLLYRNSFEVLEHCASRLPYPSFYKVWHNQFSDPQEK